MSIDRLERRLPDVLTELSLPRVPDYVDDLLVRTARTPQRPGWTYPERWFPVSTFTAALPAGRRLSMRPLIAVAIVIALVIASIVLYAGSQRRLPPLFGLARNGAVVTADTAGNIVAVDPETGSQRTLVSGTNLCCSVVAPNGQAFAFSHIPPGGNPTGITIATIDGKIVLTVAEDVARNSPWFEWSPAGDRILLTTPIAPVIVDVPSGQETRIDVPFNVTKASWIGASGDLLLTSKVSDTSFRIYRLQAGTTSNATQVAELTYAVNEPIVSPDGSRFLYFIWGPEDRLHGDLHVFDLVHGTDAALTQEAFFDSQEWENPVWSPDGSRIAAELYTAADNHIAVIPATGGQPVLVGKAFPTGQNGAAIRFAPNGQSLLVTYRFDNTTWLLPVDGSAGRQLSWATGEDIDWQRLAP